MAKSALIQELEKQFHENPRRVFARLANEYRKQGELELAIDICRQHVPLQPTYISGYIVLGQALFESGRLDDARTTFETALGLDPENLIALRQLGDIARDSGDREGARTWYRRLLEVDPQNDEIAAQLKALTPPAGAAVQTPTPHDSAAVSWSDIHPERPESAAVEGATASYTSAQAPAAEAFQPPPVDVVPESAAPPLDRASMAFDLGAAHDQLAAGLYDEPMHPESVEPEGAAPEEQAIESGSFAPAANASPEPWSHPDDVPMPHDMAAGFASLRSTHEQPTIDPAVPPAPAAPLDEEMMPAIDFAPPVERSPSFAVSQVGETETPAPFVTETMAELYLQQGFPDAAMDIYRQLIAQRPDDASLRARLAQLEAPPAAATPGTGDAPAGAATGEPTPRSVRAFFRALAGRKAPAHAGNGHPRPAPTPTPAPVAAHSSMPSRNGTLSRNGLADLFTGRTTSRTDDAAAASLAAAYSGEFLNGPLESGGQPARTASTELSLDDVFRDPRGRGDRRSAVESVSFDEFFSPRESGAQPAVAGGDSGSGASDLELFHQWLEGLKK